MDILATESVEKLRFECRKNPNLIDQTLEDLVDDFNLALIPLGEKEIILEKLVLPEGFTQETNKDLENCKILGDNLNMLSALKQQMNDFGLHYVLVNILNIQKQGGP